MFNLMQNYGIFTQICVLQGLRAKEEKRARKTTELATTGSIECHDNFNFIVTKLKEISKKSVTTIETLSRQILRRIPEKKLKLCCDISKVVVTQYKAEGKEYCRDLSTFVVTIMRSVPEKLIEHLSRKL